MSSEQLHDLIAALITALLVVLSAAAYFTTGAVPAELAVPTATAVGYTFRPAADLGLASLTARKAAL